MFIMHHSVADVVQIGLAVIFIVFMPLLAVLVPPAVFPTVMVFVLTIALAVSLFGRW